MSLGGQGSPPARKHQLATLNRRSARDWSGRTVWVAALARLLVSSGDPILKAAGVAALALTILADLDSDDELGRIDWDIPVAGPPTETRVWNIDHDELVGSSYHFEVRILITRS